ncbi:hypothetical protein HNY73_002778 [Argiope bruennichi]|uniref:Uncharacterized protein n=1 Tax=Argiope bruennichi TaxID=94029 RepID=A0A8T0FVV1_ARGBR|nr:hypothetical protein HNY73_002778 [Argiope bruennichi]
MSLKKRNTTSKGKRDNFEEEMLLAKDCRVLVEKLPESELLNLEDKTTKTASGKEKEELERHSPSTSKGRRINASSTESASPIRSSLRQRKTVVNKADSKEKEMPFTKHCHVLLERLSESQLREETMEIEVRKKREEEVEYHLPSISKGDSEIVNAPSNQNASLLEALTKQGETTMNKTDSEAHISRKFRRSRQENKRRKQKHRPCYTQRHVSKLKNDSTMELSEQEDRAPEEEDSSKFKEERPNGALLIRFKKGEATSIKDKSGFCLGHHFYFNAFRKYLIALRGIERSNILYELLQRDLKQELILQNAHDLQYDVNKKLVEWIAKSALKVKEVSLEGQWEMIKRAAMEAEQSVIDEIRKSYENRMMRKRKVQADESSNQEKVLKLPIPNLIDEKVKAAKSIKENASISVKEITNEKEHIQISSKGKGSETPILEKEISNTDPNQSEISTSERECKISTNLQSSNMTLQKDITKKFSENHDTNKNVNATNLLVDEVSVSNKIEEIPNEVPASNKTEEIVKNLKKKDETQESSNEFGVDTNTTNLLADEVPESNKTEEIVKNLKKKDETQKSWNEVGFDTNTTNLLVDEESESNKTEEIVKNLKKKDETQESSNEFGVDTNTTDLLVNEVPESNKTEEIVKNLKKKDETQKSSNEFGVDTNTTNLLVYEVSVSNKIEEIVKNLKKKAKTQESSNEFGVDTNAAKILADEVPASNKTEEIVKNLKKKDETQESSNEFGVDTNTTDLLVNEVPESNKTEEIVKNLKKKDETQKSSNEFGVDTNTTNLLADEVPESNKTEEIVKNLKKKDETQKSWNEVGFDTNTTNFIKTLKKKDETQESSNEFGVDAYLEVSEQHVNFGSGQKHNTISFLDDSSDTDTYVIIDEESESNASEISVNNFEKDDETAKLPSECGNHIDLNGNEQQEISCSKQTSSSEDARFINLEVETPETTVKSLKKYHNTQKHSSEYDVDLKIQQETNEQQESLCESVRNTVSSIECMPANERNTEGSDNIQEISFGEHSEIKQKTILASDIEKKTFSETEIIISNDRSVSLHAENKMSAISSEIWISDFEKTADAKSGHTPSEKSAIERLLEECIQLVENQDLTPSREPNEISLAKTEKNYGVAFSCSISDTGSNHSNAQERDCSSTKNTTGLNPLPVSTNDIQLLNSSENVTSATEECIQLVENQDLIPSREPSEVSVAKTQNNDGVAFSCSISDTGSNHRNAQERNCSSTKNTTDLNPLPVSTNDIPLLNNATENVASATETKTFYEAHLSSNIGSVPGSPQKSGDSSLGEINIHENVLNVYSSIYNKLVGWIPETSARVIATEMSSNVASPNLTSYHESVHTTSEEKNNSSPAITASSLGERRNSESESESDDNLSKEYCDGQGCVSCAIIVRAKAKEAFQSFKPLPLSEIPAPKTRRRRTYLQRLMNRK